MVRTPTLFRRLTSPEEDSARPRTRSRVASTVKIIDDNNKTPNPSGGKPFLRSGASRPRADTPARIRSIESMERDRDKRMVLTVRVQAAYMFILGLSTIFVPFQLCELVDKASMGWMGTDVTQPGIDTQFGAAVGFFYVYLGCFYVALERCDEFVRFTVFSRSILVPTFNGILILLGKQHPKIFLFSLIDVTLALWTNASLPPKLGPLAD